METLAFQGLVGLSLAMYLWLIAAGLTLVFGVLGILNFAHGSLFMLGGYFAFTFYGLLGINFWLSILLSLIGVALIGLIMERFFLRHIYHLDVPYQLLLTFGFILIFDDAVKMIWGGVFMIPPMPDFFTGAVPIFGRPFPIYNLFIIGAGIGVAIGLWLILERTWWGRIMRASASDREMAGAIGVNIPILFTEHPCPCGGSRDRGGHYHPGLCGDGDRGPGQPEGSFCRGRHRRGIDCLRHPSFPRL